jgi:diaminopimelate decarboxylase
VNANPDPRAETGRLRRVGDDEYGRVLRWARAERVLGPDDPSAIFIAFDVLDDRLRHLGECFPPDTLHTVAIKSNPLQAVLSHVVARGFGLEAASFEEVLLAKSCGADNGRIVFDSPAKRRSEIDYCEQRLPGLVVNANSLEELNRYRQCRRLRLGLRVNPLQGGAAPDLYDVSRPGSKFGAPIRPRRPIIEAFLAIPQLVGLHVHVGSEVGDQASAAAAVGRVFALAREIDAACARRGLRKRIEFVDIGGGAAVNYGPGRQAGLESYVAALRSCAPDLESRHLVTEFGRFTQAHCGWLVTDVEYVLRRRRNDILVVHQGADMFVREVYAPGAPRHQIRAFDALGRPRRGRRRRYRLAGPLCFAGDFIGGEHLLPEVREGDKVVVADVGANTFALWSKHCSRAFPKVVGYSLSRREIRVLKDRQSAQEAISFWT